MARASSAFVPVAMPSWLQVFARNSPITVLVDALRELILGGATASTLVLPLAWAAVVLAVFAPLAVRAYRRISQASGAVPRPREGRAPARRRALASAPATGRIIRPP